MAGASRVGLESGSGGVSEGRYEDRLYYGEGRDDDCVNREIQAYE